MTIIRKATLPAIIIFGFLLRIWNINQSLWLDEAISVTAVQTNSWKTLITTFSRGDFHPPLYYLILWMWDKVWGYSEISSRMPSVLLGAGSCFLIYLLGRKLGGVKTGLLAAALVAVNPLAVYYSQEARMYSLAMFLVILAVYFFVTKRKIGFVLAMTAAIYTDYLPALMIPTFFLLTKDKKLFVKQAIVILILFIPWLPFLYQQFSVGLLAGQTSWGDVLGRGDIKNLALIPVKFIIGRISFENKILYGLVVAMTGIFYGYILQRTRDKLIWAWLLIPIVLGVIISWKVPVLSYFRFLFVLPALCLLLALGIRKKWEAGLIILLSLICLLIFNLNQRFQREDWRKTVLYMKSEPGLVLIPSLAQSAPIKYYGPDIKIEDKSNINLDGFQRVYLLRYVQEIFDRGDTERQTIEEKGYKLAEQKDFNGVVIWKYKLVP